MVTKNNQLRDSRHLEKYFPYVSFIRRPTSTDIRHPNTGHIYSTPYFWRVDNKKNGDPPDSGTAGELWYLHDITANVATWVLSEISGGDILTLSDTAGTKTGPDGTGNVQLKSSDATISIVTDAANNLLDFTLPDGKETACANFIVDPAGTRAEYTTIQEAIDAASAGDVIFIKEGTYSEDLVIDKQLAFCSFSKPSRMSPNPVTVQPSSASFTISADCKFNGITFNTNGFAFFSISGTSRNVQFDKCKIIGEDGITCFTNTIGGNLYFYDCAFAGSSTAKLFDAQAGLVWIINCFLETFQNTASTIASGTCVIRRTVGGLAVSATGTGKVYLSDSQLGSFATPYTNITYLTTAGTGTHFVENCQLYSGTATAISIGAGTTVECFNNVINSSNTNAIDGAGTIVYAGLTYSGTSRRISTTTQTLRGEGPSRVIGGSTPGAVNYLSVANSDNTSTSSGAYVEVRSGGLSGGDPYFHYIVGGGNQEYAHGIDVSDSETWKLNAGGSVSAGTTLLSITPTGINTFGFNNAGNTNELRLENTNNTNSASHSKLLVKTGGASGGNPHLNFNVDGVTNVSMGITNSAANDPFDISDGAIPTAGNLMARWTSATNSYIFGYSQDSNTNDLRIDNSGTTDASSKLTAAVGATSTGDAYLVTQISAVRSYCFGIDNSDSDTLKINTTAAGSVSPSSGTTLLSITTAGDTTFHSTGYTQVASGTTAQKPGSPVNGMIRYDTDLARIEGYSGGAWVDLTGGGGGSGDVVGPGSATDNAICRFDTTTGKLIQNSSATLTDAGVMSTAELQLTTALDETYGGTGQTSFTTGDILYASASNTLSKLGVGSIPGDELIVNDSGVVQWDTDVIVIKEDFLGVTGSNGWLNSKSATGNLGKIDDPGGHPGILHLSVSANSDDSVYMLSNTLLNSVLIGNGVIRIDWMINIPTLNDAVDDIVIKVGLGEETAFTTSNDYVFFIYDTAIGTDWIPQVSSGGSATTASGGSSVAVDTNWTHLRMDINAAGTNVDFYVDGVDAGSATTNIPSVILAPEIKITKTAGSNIRYVYLDAFRFYNKLTSSRWS